ncbi:PREDICTED: uncharacterized protein LOC108364596 [Rhagoletis zephyria]|uniref:uncharacterized protein LOC108364596 n=1 Tax=Rhagoletis zephyria TaxID=28612 RepID=UPI00081167F0|nr:PREDICTED: uncharacterized protein LOC108364596 [Rhagoletis zephyria]
MAKPNWRVKSFEASDNCQSIYERKWTSQLVQHVSGLGYKGKVAVVEAECALYTCAIVLVGCPDPSIKYQYPKLSKLHQVVSLLTRCRDISDKCQNSNQNAQPSESIQRSKYKVYIKKLKRTELLVRKVSSYCSTAAVKMNISHEPH